VQRDPLKRKSEFTELVVGNKDDECQLFLLLCPKLRTSTASGPLVLTLSRLSQMGLASADTIATNIAMISLAKRTGFAVARKPEDGRIVRFCKDLLATNQHTRPFGEYVAAA
jgi:hypothetical protein